MVVLAKVLADSRAPMGQRLTTLEVVMPRIVLAEFNTHRMFSRNSASSRAIPVEKQIKRLYEDPFVPKTFPVNRPGMSASEYIGPGDAGYEKIRNAWLDSRTMAIKQAEILLAKKVHKQIVNRLLEPFMWHTVIVTATEWANFFTLRMAKDAQPEIQEVAIAMFEAIVASTPRNVAVGEWHLPLSNPELDVDLTPDGAVLASVGRCARVSYLTHDGERSPSADIGLAESLRENGHWSPWEHVATPQPYEGHRDREANFDGWIQARHHRDFGGQPV